VLTHGGRLPHCYSFEPTQRGRPADQAKKRALIAANFEFCVFVASVCRRSAAHQPDQPFFSASTTALKYSVPGETQEYSDISTRHRIEDILRFTTEAGNRRIVRAARSGTLNPR
jgi:hypothetical protein